MPKYIESILSSLKLFSFPNYVGNPVQKLVRTRKEALDFVTKYDGLTGIHIRANSALGLDKVIFELESSNIMQAMKSFEKLVRVLADLGIEKYTYYFFSGNKSFYTYLFIDFLISNSETVVQIYRQLYYYVTKNLPEDVRAILDENFSNPYHLVRIPNTMNEKSGFRKFLIGMKGDYSFDILYSKDVLEIPAPDRLNVKEIDLSVGSAGTKVEDIHEIITTTHVEKYEVSRHIIDLLKEIVRPVIWKEIIKPDPPHLARTAFVSELMYAGFTEDEVCEIIRFLDWSDYDEKVTRYHVHKIFEKGLTPPKTSTLVQRLGTK